MWLCGCSKAGRPALKQPLVKTAHYALSLSSSAMVAVSWLDEQRCRTTLCLIVSSTARLEGTETSGLCSCPLVTFNSMWASWFFSSMALSASLSHCPESVMALFIFFVLTENSDFCCCRASKSLVLMLQITFSTASPPLDVVPAAFVGSKFIYNNTPHVIQVLNLGLFCTTLLIFSALCCYYELLAAPSFSFSALFETFYVFLKLLSLKCLKCLLT